MYLVQATFTLPCNIKTGIMSGYENKKKNI